MGADDSEIARRAARVGFVLLDVDGVLTDGKILVFSDGTDGRAFHARDGHGIRRAREAGLAFGLLSGRSSPAVARRAEELGIAEVHQGVRDKEARYREIVARLGIAEETVCFVGDDVMDVPVLRRVGFAVAPADAADEARAAAHWVTSRRGGEGAVREVLDRALRAGEEAGRARSRRESEARRT